MCVDLGLTVYRPGAYCNGRAATFAVGEAEALVLAEGGQNPCNTPFKAAGFENTTEK